MWVDLLIWRGRKGLVRGVLMFKFGYGFNFYFNGDYEVWDSRGRLVLIRNTSLRKVWRRNSRIKKGVI